MLYYPEELIEEVRNRNDIVDLISSYVSIKKRGANYVGLCPFHSEKTGSFSVSGSKQMYKCFGCGAAGNVFTFLMEYESITFPEAVKQLAERAGISLPEHKASEEDKRRADRRRRLLDIHADAAKYYYSMLRSEQGSRGYEYFKSRQLTDETMKKFALGFTGRGGLYRFLKNQGYNDNELKDSGLIAFDEKRGAYDKFWNRVMFPIMDAGNNVIAFGGRVMGDGEPKYLNSPETLLFDKSRNLYGFNYAKHSRQNYFLLCEGYMDVIALHQAGFDNACASLGTAFTGLQANCMKRVRQKVVITYDSDGAGIKAALRAIPILKGAGISVRVLNMKPYKDPDEFIKNLGVEEYQKRIDNARSSFDFELDVLESQYDFSDPEQKTQFYNEAAKKLLAFEDELERGNYIESVAVRYSVRTEDLRNLVIKLSAEYAGMPVKTVVSRERKKAVKEDGNTQAQEILLTWIANEPGIIDKIKPYIGKEDFTEEPYSTIAAMVFGQYEQEHTVVAARILNRFEEVQEQQKVAAIFSNGMPVDEFDRLERERVINEIVKRIRQQSIDHITRSAKRPEELQKAIAMRVDLQKMHISL